MAHAFEFIKVEELPPKPRKKSVVEIRGSYYSPVTIPYLKGLFEIAGDYIDGFKWAGGSFRIHPEEVVKKINALCHQYDIYVNTGGWVERVITDGKTAVDRYFEECRKLGFDKIEVSNGIAPISTKDMVAMVKKIREVGLMPKPEVSFMKGAGAGTHIKDYKPEYKPNEEVFAEIQAYLDEGVEMIMFESEGITEDLPGDTWRTDLVEAVTKKFGFELFMFEASDPQVFKWYLQQFGKDVNLFVDHSQIVEFQCWRAKVWGNRDIWEGKETKYL